MCVYYLDCHEAGLCCYLVIHIENLLRPLLPFVTCLLTLPRTVKVYSTGVHVFSSWAVYILANLIVLQDVTPVVKVKWLALFLHMPEAHISASRSHILTYDFSGFPQSLQYLKSGYDHFLLQHSQFEPRNLCSWRGVIISVGAPC
jgi:hypothetical protein